MSEGPTAKERAPGPYPGTIADEMDDGTDLLRAGIRSIGACAPHLGTADERAEMRLIADEMGWLLARAMLLRGRHQERHSPRTPEAKGP